MHARQVSWLLIATFVLVACAPRAADESAAGTPADAAQAPAATPAPTAASPSPPAAAAAAASTTEWQALLARLDRDGDRVVARSEHRLAAADMFSRMDRDGDDAVTVAEMEVEREALFTTAPTDTALRLKQIDRNGDGHLDEDEHGAATDIAFVQYDRDGDTRLEQAEFEEASAQLRAAQ